MPQRTGEEPRTKKKPSKDRKDPRQVEPPDISIRTREEGPTATTKNSVGTRLFHHNLDLSPNNVNYPEKVYSNVRRNLGRPQHDDMEQIEEEQQAQMEDRFLSGRQITFMIYEYFRIAGAHEAVLDYSDLFSITTWRRYSGFSDQMGPSSIVNK